MLNPKAVDTANNHPSWTEIRKMIPVAAHPWLAQGLLYSLANEMPIHKFIMDEDQVSVAKRRTERAQIIEMFLEAAACGNPLLEKTAQMGLFDRILPYIEIHPFLVPAHVKVLEFLQKRTKYLIRSPQFHSIANYLCKIQDEGIHHHATSALFWPHFPLLINAFLTWGLTIHIDRQYRCKETARMVADYLKTNDFDAHTDIHPQGWNNPNETLEENSGFAQRLVNARAFAWLVRHRFATNNEPLLPEGA